ncbi:toxin-antitoxin system YwqK family antitoxin [Aquimarina sp. 2201CG14-23]|uniref:toxin-antitoxin system YwqK family antitoxin n=1 Tax=Aquimarina mycalae TaxID=3040073 RepID=UPI002478042F|nr:hypothetical protein [Aquimarina sp. 2201CG14-23]MDH7444005.1 hypothetical protein [Aquimarina sp. 2201CG14-23]
MRSFYLLIVIIGILSCKKQVSNYDTTNICKEKIQQTSKNGYTKNYFANSINLKSIGHYQNGLQQGFWKYFYRNGNTKAEGHYEKGKKQGFWKEYHKNGNVKSEGHIENCEPSGYWKFYDKQNALIKENHY